VNVLFSISTSHHEPGGIGLCPTPRSIALDAPPVNVKSNDRKVTNPWIVGATTKPATTPFMTSWGGVAGTLPSIVTGFVTTIVEATLMVCGQTRMTPPGFTAAIAASIVGYVAATPTIGEGHTPAIDTPGSTAANGLNDLVRPPSPPCTAYAGVGRNSDAKRDPTDVIASSVRAASPVGVVRDCADAKLTPSQCMKFAFTRGSNSTVVGFAGFGCASCRRSAIACVAGANGSPTSS